MLVYHARITAVQPFALFFSKCHILFTFIFSSQSFVLNMLVHEILNAKREILCITSFNMGLVYRLYAYERERERERERDYKLSKS